MRVGKETQKRLLVVLFVAAVGVALDLWSKSWAESDLQERGQIEVIENCFHFTFTKNPHGAFSLFKSIPESIRQTGLIVASILAVVVIGYFILRPAAGSGWWMTIAFSLVLAGALGNLYDRVFLGYVRDFIDWHYKREFTWPTFNLADSYISVGVAILVVATLFQKGDRATEGVAEAQRKSKTTAGEAVRES